VRHTKPYAALLAMNEMERERLIYRKERERETKSRLLEKAEEVTFYL